MKSLPGIRLLLVVLTFLLLVVSPVQLASAQEPTGVEQPLAPAQELIGNVAQPVMSTENKIEKLLEKLLEGVPNAQTVAIFYAEPTQDDVIISCYTDVVSGMDSLCGAFQNQSTKPFAWFMGEIFATGNKAPHDRLVITDYDTLPDDEPLKQYYPPNFVSVGDYPLWADGKFIGWIGILSTQDPIDWGASKAFISDTIEHRMDALADAYHGDFMKNR